MRITKRVIAASQTVRPGTPSLQFTLLNTSTYQIIVKISGIINISNPPTEIVHDSRLIIPPKIEDI